MGYQNKMGLISNGTTLLDAGALDSGVPTGSMTLLSTATANNSSTITFNSGINSTYKEYIVKWFNVHPNSNDQQLTVNFRDGSTAYDATKTTTYFRASHGENDDPASLQYEAAADLAQDTGVQKLSKSGIGNGGDESLSGELMLFNPSSTTFVKHFIAKTQYYGHDDQSSNDFIAGYCNVTAAIDAVQFAFTGGNIESGKVQLYGIKDS